MVWGFGVMGRQAYAEESTTMIVVNDHDDNVIGCQQQNGSHCVSGN